MIKELLEKQQKMRGKISGSRVKGGKSEKGDHVDQDITVDKDVIHNKDILGLLDASNTELKLMSEALQSEQQTRDNLEKKLKRAEDACAMWEKKSNHAEETNKVLNIEN